MARYKSPTVELLLAITDIPWSTSHVFERTLAQARDLGLRVATMKTLRDVDTVADLRPGTPS